MVSTLLRSFPCQGIYQMQDQHAVPPVCDQMMACRKEVALDTKIISSMQVRSFYIKSNSG